MKPELWSEAEFASAVTAYLKMLAAHKTAQPFNRAEIRRDLLSGPLAGRSESAFEYRMQNISAVLEFLGHDFLPGYPPARNVGPRATRIISALLEGAVEQSEAAPEAAIIPTIYVTGMWGFEPAEDGYVGFTSQKTRDRLAEIYQPGDLMVIVGQNSEFTAAGDVGRMLGLVELLPTPIFDNERASAERYAAKVKQWGVDKWRYALPISKAWNFRQTVKASSVLPETYTHRYARVIGNSFRTISTKEAARIMGMPVRAVGVYGQSEWKPDEENSGGTHSVANAIRRGPKPWFGTTDHTTSDSETTLYVMKLSGDADALFPGRHLRATKRVVIKVGRSSDVKRRRAELNFGFAKSGAVSWEIELVQRFATADEAHRAEQATIDRLVAQKASLGGEFAIVTERELPTLLSADVGSSAFFLRA